MSTDTDKAKEFFDEPAVKCEWKTLDDYGTHKVYKTSCGEKFQFLNNLTPKENSMKYCCYCGGKIL